MNKKVAVIGATGFVGKQVVNELSNRGYSVNAIARDSSKVEAKDNVTAISADVNNVEELTKALERK
jgi:putative NADH-flavin reductase